MQMKGHACTLMAALLFGLMSPMCKLAMQSGVVDGINIATLRVTGAALLFWLISPLVPRERIERKDWLALIGMSCCGMLLNQFCYVIGIQYTSPTNACVVGTITPVFTFILSAIVWKLLLMKRKVIGLCLAISGALLLMIGSQAKGGLSGNPLGDGLCLVSQFSAACYFVFFWNVLRRYHAITIMKWLFLIASLIVLPFAGPALVQLPWEQVNLTELFGICYVVVCGSFFAYLMLIIGQQRLEPPTVATYNYVQPLIAAAVGIVLGLDALNWQKCAAMLLIAWGVWFVTHTPHQNK